MYLSVALIKTEERWTIYDVWIFLSGRFYAAEVMKIRLSIKTAIVRL